MTIPSDATGVPFTELTKFVEMTWFGYLGSGKFVGIAVVWCSPGYFFPSITLGTFAAYSAPISAAVFLSAARSGDPVAIDSAVTRLIPRTFF